MPLVGFYGDDFTGSVDALLQLRRAGLGGVLVTSPEVALPPGDPHVVGVAGTARSQPADLMADEVKPALTWLRDLGPAVVQYKACSTADSAPHTGSLGRAIELGREVFPGAPVPVVFAQPAMGRYTFFSHHFAREDGAVYRIDRQPTMRSHPVTPATESDLRLHLGAQTGLPIGDLQWLELADSDRVAAVLNGDDPAVVCDALTEEHLDVIAAALLAGPPRFAIASGGLSGALGRVLALDRPLPPLETDAAPAVTLVLSGSRSALTARQVEAAVDSGWARVDLFEPDAGRRTEELIAAGCDVVVESAKSARTVDSATIEAALAEIGAARLRANPDTRLVLCGGDTSGNVLRRLRIERLVIASEPWGNVPLCVADSRVEVVLKGGQMGHPELFDDVRRGVMNRKGL